MSTEFEDWVDRARNSPIELEIARRGIPLRRSGAERVGPCPRCGGTDRFSVNPALGVWNCRQCKPDNIAGDVIGMVMWLDNTGFVRAVETINAEPPPLNGSGREHGEARQQGKSEPREVAHYDYVDETCKLLFQVVRYDPKAFRQRRPVSGGWEWSIKGVRLVPFRLPELIEAVALEHQIMIVEGEKDVLTLRARGVVATCNPMGAGKWRPEFNEFFRDADVVVIADRDPQSINAKTGEKLFHQDGRPRLPGLDHALDIAGQLKPIAANVRMFEVGELWRAAPEKADIADWLDSGNGTIEALNDFVAKRESWSPQSAPVVRLNFIDMSAWDAGKAPARQWAVYDRIPARQPTLLSGEGSIGKTILELQLCAAHVLGRDWIGSLPQKGPAIYWGAEDDGDELHRRHEPIIDLYQVTFKELIANGLHLLSFAGEDCLLAVPNRSGQIVPTQLYGRLLEATRDIKPVHIGIDTSADVFGGNEIDRAQVRQFVSLLRKLAMTCNGSVVLLAHPSLEGIRSGTGISGSTGWHNSVRARMYFRSARIADDEPDTGLRELEFKKNNYGPVAETLKLEYHNGIFRPLHIASPIELKARERRVEELFIIIFLKLIAQGWTAFSPKKRAADEYTPRMIAKHPDAITLNCKERDFEAAMLRLIAADRLHVATIKTDRKPRERLVLGPAPKDDRTMFENST